MHAGHVNVFVCLFIYAVTADFGTYIKGSV